MARINASTNEKIVSIKAFLGLHESPDGDNKLKLGEAARMQNFKITENGNLWKRPGTVLAYDLDNTGEAPIKGMWHGFVNKREILVAACNDKLWLLMDNGSYLTIPQNLGTYSTTNDVCFFGFEENLYALNGSQYIMIHYTSNAWAMENLTSGSYGYRPLVKIGVTADGGGDLHEEVNKLNGLRRMWISPDGDNNSFPLPEKNVQSIDYVKDLTTNSTVDPLTYDKDTVNGTVTFHETPPFGVNSYEIGWIHGTHYESTVAAMKYAELYAGTQDNRIFLYGDGTNKAFYSGLDYDGNPRADYFPDLYVVDVGDANTPITGLIRHYAKMIAFKPNQAYSIDYGVVTMADSLLTPAFYSTPVNKNVGNQAPGQIQLVGSAPRTLCEGAVYEWRNGSAYSANISMDERQAKRISDRVYKTLRDMDFSKVHCYDDNFNQEYYIVDENGNMLIHNYFVDAWYWYTGILARMVYSIGYDVLIGTQDGKILNLTADALGDYGESSISCTGATVNKATWETMMSESGTYVFVYDGEHWYLGLLRVELEDYGITYTGTPEEGDKITVNYLASVPIECWWESGSMDFGASYMRKYSALVWVGVKAEEGTHIEITAGTDKSLDNTIVEVGYGEDSYLPRVKRCKIKTKKFVYYKLTFHTNTDNTKATVVDTEIKVRYTSQAK